MQKIVVLATSAAVVGLTPAVGNLTLNAECGIKKFFRLPLGKSVLRKNKAKARQDVAWPMETALSDGKVTMIEQPETTEQRGEAQKRAFIRDLVVDGPKKDKESEGRRQGSAVSRKPTSRPKKVSYDAKLKTTPSGGDLKQQCQGTFQTQKNPTVFKQSSRLASVSKGGYVGQPMLKQEKESVADELERAAVETVKRSVETAETQSTINHVEERSSPETSAAPPLLRTRAMPTLFDSDNLPSEKLIHRQSQLLAEGTNWEVRQGKIGENDVYIRWYKLEGRNAAALWKTICRKTDSRAAYGYIYEDCLCAVFDSQVDVMVKVDGEKFYINNEIFAYFDVNDWHAGSALVLQATNWQGRDCAVKVLEDPYGLLGDDIEHEWRVMKALARLPFVPRFYGVIVRGGVDERHYVISEWVRGHPLYHTNNKHDHKGCGRILKALLQQIRAMHELGYAHRDIKPANIMKDMDGNIRVVDFEGASQQYVDYSRGTPAEVSFLGTHGFMAPEVLFNEQEDVVDAFAADVYSIAMTWHYIFFRKLYITDEHNKCAYDIVPLKMPGTVPMLDEAMENLFYGMAHPDPKKRISIDQALNHKYFEMLADL